MASKRSHTTGRTPRQRRGAHPRPTGPPQHFARIAGRVSYDRLSKLKVAVIGVGSVGSRVAVELARSAVGTLVLIDGKRLTPENLTRHELGHDAVGQNKAEAMARHITSRIPSARVEVLARNLTTRVSNAALDATLGGCDLIVAATDDRRAQRRINRRAIALGIPAVYPMLEERANRGEVFVFLERERTPCFECWDGFREIDGELRGVTALGTDLSATIDLTVRLSLGILDPASDYADLYVGSARPPGPPRPRTLFMVGQPGAPDLDGALTAEQNFRGLYPDFRPDCPACGGGPGVAPEPRMTATARPPASRRTATPEPTTPEPITLPSLRPPGGWSLWLFWVPVLLICIRACG
jgi:hypothetical protein